MNIIDEYLGLFIALAFIALFGSIPLGVNAVHRYQCNQFGRMTGYAVKWSNFDACYVSRDGRFWRWDEYILAYATTAEKEAP